MGVKTKEMKVLSIKQMHQLKELGVDTSKASMCYISKYTSCDFDDGDEIVVVCNDFNKRLYNEFGPAFTLQDIIELLPYTFNNNYLRIYRSISIYYFIYENMNLEDDVLEKGRNPLEAAYNMLIWVIENGYLKMK